MEEDDTNKLEDYENIKSNTNSTINMKDNV